MTHVYLGTLIGYLRDWKGRLACLPLAALTMGLATSAMAQTSDIRAYGARCDGGDDSGALNAAFRAMPNGGTLLLNCTLGIGPAGIVLNSKQNVTVDGAGGSLVGLANNNAKVLFRVEYCEGCTIRNLTIEGRNVGAGGVSMFWSSNSTLENTTVTNASYPAIAGIMAMGNRGNRYVNNTVADTTGNGSDGTRGLWFGNPDSKLVEWNPVIMNNTARDIAATGMVLHSSGDATVSGNLVERTQGSGLKLEPHGGSSGTITIQGNTFRNNKFHGIQIYRAESPVVIQNNTIASNTMAGVYSSGGAFNNGQITGNTLSDNAQGNVFLYDGRNLTIQGNQMTGGANGIVIEANSGSNLGNVQVSSNSISGSRYDGVGLRGRGGSMSGLTFSGNSFTGNRQYGVVVDDYNGAFSGVNMNSNCFSSNGAGALFDTRALLSGIFQSSSCGNPAQTETQTQAVVNQTTAPSSGGSTMTPIRVNAGGGQYTDANGNLWSGDYGSTGGYSYVVGSSISNTNSQPLYQAVRWNNSALDYNFNVTAGTRTVTLKFSETYFSSPNQRIFDVWINGQQVLSNFDIVAQGGRNSAVDRTFQVSSSGQISIHMQSKVDDPVISAIEIR